MSILVCWEKTRLALFYVISQNLPEKINPSPTVVAYLIGHLPFIGHIFTLFQVNYLHQNPYVGVCFGGNSNQHIGFNLSSFL